MLIKVKAFPQAGKEEIIKKADDSFEIWVKAKPVQGRANRAISRVLADYFNLPAGKIRMLKGFKERNKIFEVKNDPDN
ncbi:MAG: hypothetical protein AUJ11_01065 [Parcubacteria group bacterium CG1_02_44_65]|uniref:Uncharacterized protein n=1 Tax=Candidatus Portnoybacteria bacterium CG_4_9_14_3_um_filter_43_11 TaxID=1974805 RepID=A0A2M7YLV6_9BACT|nr:MAG: hypothetical protein AUJ11_01065 [Parcubacteria group bacterium CG1_02_44_65]PJA63971.1 MAG: hypothetical protein CO160_01065 [Candidatus Portnoybacteria bacterium CG_4_9_14_3_um_filter_43_11]